MMRSVERILAVFESFSPGKASLSLQEISDRIGLPKSTTFRIIQSLEECGYLVRLEDQKYCLSFRFTRLAGMVKSTLGIREIARPVMARLAETTQETVAIHTVVGRHRVCIDALANSSSALRAVIQPGQQVPLGAGSGSRTLMAYMAQRELAPIVTSAARSSGVTPSRMLAELARVRARGYDVSHGERLEGMSAISAPIRDVNDSVGYCLTVNGPSVRVQMHEKELIQLVTTAAAEISLQFGGISRASA
jgi:DNA-binding IclR family transcriptional regulator